MSPDPDAVDAVAADAPASMTAGLILCGALGREVKTLIEKHSWDAEMIGVPAIDHVFPERIAPDVEALIVKWQEEYARIIVVFGDCGSYGALDKLLARYPKIERISGPHCYEFYGGNTFQTLMAEEPGTFLLTDFLVRTCRGLISKSMGLDRFPELRQAYFRNYKRLVCLAQTNNSRLCQKAEEIANDLELPLEIRETGLGPFEVRLAAIINVTSAIHIGQNLV